MFGQFRQVVEGLSTPSSLDNSPDAEQLHGSRPATPLRPDSPLTNLRKSMASQRGQSASPVPRTSSVGKKLSLEDRLRASLTTGDVSGTNGSKRATQSIADSQRATPLSSSPAAEPDPPLHVPPTISPSLIPLPDSPPLSPVLEKAPENILAGSMTQEPEEERGMDSPISFVAVPAGQSDSEAHTGLDSSSDIESLQERLKQVEQRFLGTTYSLCV